MRYLLIALSLISSALSSVSCLAADAYPTKPIRMLVAFAPGGSADINARQFAQVLSKQLGQPVVVENKAGAGGNIAAGEVARAAPDGYTIFYATSAIVFAPSLYPKLTYDPFRDFIPVALTATIPLVLVVNPKLPVKDVKDLIAYVKGKPEGVNYASSGSGALLHLAGAQFSQAHELKTTHVPYKGSAPAITDVIGGQVDFMFVPINESVSYIRGGRLRALAVTTSKRQSLLPDTPTLSEALGTKSADVGAWQGIVVPKGTPKEVVARLSAEVTKALQNPELRKQLESQGSELLGGTAEQYAAYMKEEYTRWGEVIKKGNIKAD